VIGILAAMSVTWFIVRQSARIDHWIGAEGSHHHQLRFSAGSTGSGIGSAGIRELFLL